MKGAFFDSHCHLDPDVYGGDDGVDAVVATAVAAGVRWMVTIGAGYGDGAAARAVAVADRHPTVWASVGVHPHDASTLDEACLEGLAALASHPKVVAWGEVGLDFHYDLSPRPVQREALRWQVRMALSRHLPLVIHDRESDGETFRVLREEGAFDGAGVLYHCYAGTPDEMLALVDAGGHLSIPGTVTWRKSEVLQEVVRRAPLDRLLVETDAPFLTPEPLRGTRNEPCHVALTAEAVAGLRGMSVDDLADATAHNTARLFRITR